MGGVQFLVGGGVHILKGANKSIFFTVLHWKEINGLLSQIVPFVHSIVIHCV